MTALSSGGISVVIPAFNRADLLPATLRSILAQSVPADEVIVVDDGSTDSTRDVVAPFAPNVRYIYIENAGMARARTVGVTSSAGKYIALCDSDDLWSEDKLEWQMRLVRQGAPYVFTDFLILENERTSSETKFAGLPPGYWDVPKRDLGDGLVLLMEPFYGRILRHQPIFPSTVLLSRAYFDRVGGFDDALGRTLSEDLEFTLRCLEHAPVGVVMRPLVTIRKHVSNFSRDPRRALLGEAKVLRIALERHATAAAFREEIEAEIARRSVVAADFAYADGDLTETRRILESVPRPRLRWKSRLKLAATRLPPVLGRPARRATLAMSRLLGRRPNAGDSR